MLRALKLALAAAVSLSLVTAVEARKGQTQDIDFGSYTCKAFLYDISEASEEDVGAVLLWLDGYLSGVSGDTVLRWRGLEAFTTALVERCNQRGNERLLDAARRVGIN